MFLWNAENPKYNKKPKILGWTKTKTVQDTYEIFGVEVIMKIGNKIFWWTALYCVWLGFKVGVGHVLEFQ